MAATTTASTPSLSSQQPQPVLPDQHVASPAVATSSSSSSTTSSTTITDSKQSSSSSSATTNSSSSSSNDVTAAVPGVMDVFDALLHMESDFIAEGAARGERDGLRQGFFEGRAMVCIQCYLIARFPLSLSLSLPLSRMIFLCIVMYVVL